MNRKYANALILKMLTEYLQKNPDIRFMQALENLDIIVRGCDLFYEESTSTLKRMSENYS